MTEWYKFKNHYFNCIILLFKFVNDKNVQYFIKNLSFHLILTDTVLESRYKYYLHFIVKAMELSEHYNYLPKIAAIACCKAGAELSFLLLSSSILPPLKGAVNPEVRLLTKILGSPSLKKAGLWFPCVSLTCFLCVNFFTSKMRSGWSFSSFIQDKINNNRVLIY